jgi:tRNA(adenine34) deaminase
MTLPPTDESWMQWSLAEARLCLRSAEFPTTGDSHTSLSDVPVGAICVYENRIVAQAHNRREIDADPTAHAEVLCLREAARVLGRRHLEGVTLYVTLEPCPMCAGAIWLARPSRVVFGAWDARAGACGSVFDVVRDPRLNFRTQVRGGVLQEQCAALLDEFFARRRSGTVMRFED